jgi:hypothetical protein
MKPGERFPVCRYCPHCHAMQVVSTMVDIVELKDEPDGPDEHVTYCAECGRWSRIVSAYHLKKLPKAEEAKIAATDIGRAMRLARLLAHMRFT